MSSARLRWLAVIVLVLSSALNYLDRLVLAALMPTPGNAELVVYVLAMILLAIIALASDAFDVGGWVTAFTAITVAYLISRGIAKASRVLER